MTPSPCPLCGAEAWEERDNYSSAATGSWMCDNDRCPLHYTVFTQEEWEHMPRRVAIIPTGDAV